MKNSLLYIQDHFLAILRILGFGSISVNYLNRKYNVSDKEYIRVRNVDIHYKDEGEGPVLVLLHGICSSLYTWDGWVDVLKRHFRIIRIDIPGFGLTGPCDIDPRDLDEVMCFTHDIIKAFNLDSFYLAGSSLGGYLSWNYALRNPHMVKKLVLIDPVSHKQTPPWFIVLSNFFLFRFIASYSIPKLIIWMNVRAIYGDTKKISRDLVNLYFDMAMRKGNKASYMKNFHVMAEKSIDEGLSDGIQDIKVPVLVMYGEKDKWVPITHVERWKENLPGVKSIVYQGVGHIPMEEIPEQSAKDALQFMFHEDV